MQPRSGEIFPKLTRSFRSALRCTGLPGDAPASLTLSTSTRRTLSGAGSARLKPRLEVLGVAIAPPRNQEQKPSKLVDAQVIVISATIQRQDRAVLPLPASLKAGVPAAQAGLGAALPGGDWSAR
jgi:hypothetical protein